MKISLAITTYNRSDLTIESFSKVYDLVDEIVIVDDASEPENYRKLLGLIKGHPAEEKIFLYRNGHNLGMSRNKREAISRVKNEWCIILDSDNQIFPEYIDSLNGQELNPNTIYCPVFARPRFDFRKFSGGVFNKHNAKDHLEDGNFRVFLNTCNYVVNRDKYLEVYQYNEGIKGSDTIWFNYLWLAAGNNFYFVNGMEYIHEVHEGSGWLQDREKNMNDANMLQEKIKNL